MSIIFPNWIVMVPFTEIGNTERKLCVGGNIRDWFRTYKYEVIWEHLFMEYYAAGSGIYRFVYLL